MSNIISDFKQKIMEIIESIDKASSNLEKEKMHELERNHELTLKELKKEKQDKLKDIKDEYDKRLKLLSSNQETIDEYDEYVSAAESIYNKKVSEIKSIYENDINIEDRIYSNLKEKTELKLTSNKKNFLRKKFDKLKEDEVELLVKQLDDLNNKYNSEKEEIEKRQKEELKKLKEEFSADGIEDLEVIYIPEEEREKIAKYVLSGYLPPKLIDNNEILIGDEIGKRKLSDKIHNEVCEKESDFRKLNEEKYLEISEAIKQIRSLKFEDIEQEVLNETKTLDEQEDFDPQER